jgi:hypothetical protein
MAEELGVSAAWETDWLELSDDDPTRASLVLIPTYVFGEAFAVSAVERLPSIDPCAEVPARLKVPATVSRRLYTVMIRFQQGAESFGDDPPPWALIEGSATDLATGRVMGTGEVFAFGE